MLGYHLVHHLSCIHGYRNHWWNRCIPPVLQPARERLTEFHSHLLIALAMTFTTKIQYPMYIHLQFVNISYDPMH